jgi:hypothetical protein
MALTGAVIRKLRHEKFLGRISKEVDYQRKY